MEFDMEELCRRVDGAMDPRDDRERELVARGVRLFASLVLPPRSVNPAHKMGRAMCLRLAVAVYLCRIPGHERFRSMADIGRRFGVSNVRVHELARELVAKMNLPEKITAKHRKRAKS